MSAIAVPHIVVIDPAVHTPELDTFNHMCGFAPLPLTYHLPALFGFHSFPADETLIRAVIILGSAASVYDHLPWQRPLEAWLRPIAERGIPVLGLCYGHQMLAHMFGGKVSYHSPEQKKLTGVRDVHITDKALKASGIKRLIVTHNEVVTALPDCMDVIATSPAVAIDGLKHKKRPVFGFQAHPEATVDFLRSRGMIDAQAVEALPEGHQLLRGFFDLVGRT